MNKNINLLYAVFEILCVFTIIFTIDYPAVKNKEANVNTMPTTYVEETLSPTVVAVKKTESPTPTLEPTTPPTATPVVTLEPTATPTIAPTIAPTEVPQNLHISSRGDSFKYSRVITGLTTAYTINEDGWGELVLWSGGPNKLPAFSNVPGMPSYELQKTWYNNYGNNHRGQWGYVGKELRVRYGVVAVDPRIIPLGTALYIENYGYAIAVDIGGFIRRNSYASIEMENYSQCIVIDCWFESAEQCYSWGVREQKIYILEDQTTDIFKARQQ